MDIQYIIEKECRTNKRGQSQQRPSNHRLFLKGKTLCPQPSNQKQQRSIYCIIAAARRDTSAEETRAKADTLAAAPASGAGAGAEEGAMKSCAEAEAKKTATARSSTATRGAITTLRCSLRVDRRIGEEGSEQYGGAEVGDRKSVV